MWLVLSTITDPSAEWVTEGLRARGLTPLEWVNDEALAAAPRWEHRLGAAGTNIEIVLADGLHLRNHLIRGVLNRLVSVPIAALQPARSVDRDYAVQEFSAFFLSWLHALPSPLINRPVPLGLCGAWRHISEWVWLAAQAGLPTSPYRQGSDDVRDECGEQGRLVPPETPVQKVIVIGKEIVGAPFPAMLQEGCRRLARLAGVELLGIDFTMDATGSWNFAGATPWPDLRLGGEALLDALASILSGERKASL